MARDFKAIDISDEPALLRLVEEARAADEPRLLRRGDEDLAVLRPVKRSVKGPARPRRGHRDWRPTEEEIGAVRSAAGSWADVDTERLKADIEEARRAADRPPVEL